MTARDLYVAKMKLQLDELNLTMTELETKARETQDDSHAPYQQQIVKLRARSKVAVEKLDALKADGEESWNRLVREVEKLSDAFTRSFRYFKSQI